jgi:Protein of unknown function (DUF3024)
MAACATASMRRATLRSVSANAIPQHTVRLAERLLGSYCARICPPTARHAAQLGYELEVDRITLFELRLFCGVPGATRRVPLAQLRFRAARNEWQLLYADAALRWRRYRLLPTSTSVVALLREIDSDPARLFWPHINGFSLRWCSSRGRCSECDLRYCAVLGLAQSTRAQVNAS